MSNILIEESASRRDFNIFNNRHSSGPRIGDTELNVALSEKPGERHTHCAVSSRESRLSSPDLLLLGMTD